MMNNCFVGRPRDIYSDSGCHGGIDEEVHALILSKTIKLAKEAIIRSFEKADFSNIGSCIGTVEHNGELNAVINGALGKVVSGFTTCYIGVDAEVASSSAEMETSKRFIDEVLLPLRNDAEVRAAMKGAMLRIANGE